VGRDILVRFTYFDNGQNIGLSFCKNIQRFNGDERLLSRKRIDNVENEVMMYKNIIGMQYV
jgi:hypothetical protein